MLAGAWRKFYKFGVIFINSGLFQEICHFCILFSKSIPKGACSANSFFFLSISQGPFSRSASELIFWRLLCEMDGKRVCKFSTFGLCIPTLDGTKFAFTAVWKNSRNHGLWFMILFCAKGDSNPRKSS